MHSKRASAMLSTVRYRFGRNVSQECHKGTFHTMSTRNSAHASDMCPSNIRKRRPP